MKKNILISLSFIAIAGISIIIINACSKSENSLKTQKNYQYVEFVPEQDNIIPLIKNFLVSHGNFLSGIKVGEEYPLNEAIWNIEAGINYTYASSKEGLNDFVKDSTVFIMNVDEISPGDIQVNSNELNEVFTESLNFTDELLSGNQRILLVAGVKLNEINATEAELKIFIISGIIPPQSCEIEVNDHWYFANGHGKCSPYSGYSGKDASTRINWILNCTSYSCPGGSVFFTNPTDYTWVPTASAADEWYCSDQEDMEFFLSEAWYTIDYYKPSGKVFTNCIYTWDYIQGSYVGHTFEELHYAVLNCKPDETK